MCIYVQGAHACEVLMEAGRMYQVLVGQMGHQRALVGQMGP